LTGSGLFERHASADAKHKPTPSTNTDKRRPGPDRYQKRRVMKATQSEAGNQSY
jgi:hypothetical protein